MCDVKNGKLIGVQKGCFDSKLDDGDGVKAESLCPEKKIEDKRNCYCYTDSELTAAIKKCVRKTSRCNGMNTLATG